MAIRRISDLDQLSDLSDEYLNSLVDVDGNTGEVTFIETPNDFNKYIFEVSKYIDDQPNERPSYYISNKITYQNLSRLLTFPVKKRLDSFFNSPSKELTGDMTTIGNINANNLSTVGNVSCNNIYNNDIQCKELSAATSISCGGSVTCNYLTANNQITCKSLKATTNITCDNQITCKSLKATTNITCDNQITCKSLKATGNISCEKLYGIATSAYWADLAEMYESDYDYEPGTLVKFGGQKEITVADHDVNAVITTSPGLVLNSGKQENKLMKGIALVGRVPVKVIGEIQKFDNITLSKQYPGYATKASDIDKIIGKALETNYSHDCKLVECIVKMTF